MSIKLRMHINSSLFGQSFIAAQLSAVALPFLSLHATLSRLSQ
jgi:hypothetical protein